MTGRRDTTEAFGLDVHRDGDTVVIALHGELDLATAPLLEQALEYAAATAATLAILDLYRLRFMDAAGLSVIMAAARTFALRLVLRSPSLEVRRVLAITGADRRLTLQPPVLPHGSLAERGEANVAYVRRVWEAVENRGPAALAELVPDDVVWRPTWGEGEVLLGTSELIRRWAEVERGRRCPRSFTADGEDVVVAWDLEVANGDVREFWSLWRFDGPRLIEVITYDQLK